MTTRGSEAWWHEHWGQPCKGPRATVLIRGHRFTVDKRAVPAFAALDAVFAHHGVDVHPPYPQGDSGTGNCRHIGNDPKRPWSSHAWWAALDRNWNTNPDGSRLVTDLPREVIDDVHAIRTRSGAPVWRWGGDWDRDPRTGHSYYDAMHFEVHATPAELAQGIDPRTVPGDTPPAIEEVEMYTLTPEQPYCTIPIVPGDSEVVLASDLADGARVRMARGHWDGKAFIGPIEDDVALLPAQPVTRELPAGAKIVGLWLRAGSHATVRIVR